MEYLFDTINLADIRRFGQIFPIAGVTSNPSIIRQCGKIDFFEHFRAIRKEIGKEKSLHIQVTAIDAEGMKAEGLALLKRVDDSVLVKVPVTEEGLLAMQMLKAEGAKITATAVYSKTQGLLALQAGADFIAPYYNRMERSGINPNEVISSLARMIEEYDYPCKILAASFANIEQVNSAFLSGAHMATLKPSLLHEALQIPEVQRAVENFAADWESLFGRVSIDKM